MIDNNILVAIISVLSIILLLMFVFGGEQEYTQTSIDSEALEKMENEAYEMQNQRIQLMCKTVDVLWNGLSINSWLEVDHKTNEDINTEAIWLSPDVCVVYSTYNPRSLKITYQLNWSKQKAFIRIEQQLQDTVIEVTGKEKIKAGTISLLQANDITSKYFDLLIKIYKNYNENKTTDENDSKDNESNE